MTFKCAHISDIHWRGLKRHDEYKSVFTKLFDNLREEENLDAIFIGGDIVHSKTQGISPELIESLHWWFKELSSIAPTHVILGNHDGLILNKDRQDAITPIVNALDDSNIFLYKESGTYPTGKPGINWCVFSCFDEENWSKVKPINGDINIACFHGAVWGSKTDIDWELEGEVNLSFFEDFEFSFLGDIHKLQYLDKEKRVAYPGSTVQQNYGEDVRKGYLLWEIKNANDFSSKFISIENPHPFITVDWQGSFENTLPYLQKIKKGARFRIRSHQNISQIEIKLLHHYLKEDKKAKEVVYQNTGKNEIDIQSVSSEKAKTFDIRNKTKRSELLKEFFGDSIEENITNDVNDLFTNYLDDIPKDLSTTNSSYWTIHDLSFDNTFSYGKNNLVNFDNLSGVVGLFGNNRAGKSSIPGSLMYCLFNSTDRGAIKNQNIVNIRKGSCKATANISVGQERFLIERATTKKSDKKGKISSTTSLTLKSLSEDSNQTEEQRRETEKLVRDIIGTPEDFLYTSFASQGEMNTFIKEKSSARKTVLSKFLNLDLYEELYKKSREDYIVLKNKHKNLEEKNWNNLIEECDNNINNNILEQDKIKDELSLIREKEVKVKVELNNLEKNQKSHLSGYSLDSALSERDYLKNRIKSNKNNVINLEKEVENNKSIIEKIKDFKKSFSIDELEEQKSKLNILKQKLNSNKRNQVFVSEEIKRNKNSLKILEEVPCDETFSECKFIKDAYASKDQIKKLNNEIRSIETNVLEITTAVRNIEKENIEDKIKKFNSVLNKEYKNNLDLERNKEKIDVIKNKIQSDTKKLESLDVIVSELEASNNDSLNDKVKSLKQKLNQISSAIYDKESFLVKINKDQYEIENKIKSLSKEREEYLEVIEKWKTYDLFSYAVSKKGIPAMLISNSLPLINKEINKILSGVATFTISLEDDGTSLNVYIDYGDSKRIIECASGMEKMITSIAIRVALINISSLPKSNIFIIDEGFGALDDSNIEACSRLLTSLKKYFKTILIISHVDSIKDIVDKNIEINRKGADSYVYCA